MNMWFEELTGFKEHNPDQVRSNIVLDNEHLISLVNGRKFKHGRLDVPTLEQLKQSSPPIANYDDHIRVSEVVANVRKLHSEKDNRGALFQAASQFNLLEMQGPHISPESGVGIYETDYTQDPACAIACGAGTILEIIS